MVIQTLPDIIKLFCCFLMWQFLTSSNVTELIYIHIYYSIAVEARVHGDLARVIVFSTKLSNVQHAQYLDSESLISWTTHRYKMW